MNKLKILFGLLLLSYYSLVNFSCNTSGVTPTNYARVQVVNTLSGSTPINFFLNFTKKNTSTITFPASSGYISVVPDTLYAQFQTASSLTYLNTTATADQHLSFKLDSSYSVFLTGTTSNYAIIRTQDSLFTPSAGKAKLRFVNTCVSTGALDITINGTTGFSKIDYKGVGSFIEVPAGIYEFRAYYTGQTNSLTTLSTQTLADGKIYTLYAAGQVGSTETNAAFGLNLIANLQPATK